MPSHSTPPQALNAFRAYCALFSNRNHLPNFHDIAPRRLGRIIADKAPLPRGLAGEAADRLELIADGHDIQTDVPASALRADALTLRDYAMQGDG